MNHPLTPEQLSEERINEVKSNVTFALYLVENLRHQTPATEKAKECLKEALKSLGVNPI